MPQAVSHSVDDFLEAVAEAVVIVLLVSLVSLGLRTGLVVVISIPLVLAMTFAVHVHVRHRPAQDFARRPGAGAGPAGGRRDHRRGDDGGEDGAGLRPPRGGQLRLDQHGLPDAHRHPGDRRRLPADRARAIEHRRIHPLDVPGVGHRADRLLVRRGGADSAARLPPAARAQARRPRGAAERASRRSPRGARHLRHALLPAAARLDRLVHRAPLRGAGHHRRAVRGGAGAASRLVPQQFFPSSDRPELLVDVRLPEGASFPATLEQTKRLEKVLENRPEIDHTVSFVGTGAPRFYLPLDQQLPAAELRAVRGHGQVGGGAREARQLAGADPARAVPGDPQAPVAAGERAAGRLSGAVPRQRRQHRDGALDRREGGGQGARGRALGERAVRLGRAGRALGALRDRPEEGARAERHLAGRLELPRHDPAGHHRHAVSRARQADRGRPARAEGRSRRSVPARHAGDAHPERPGAAGHARPLQGHASNTA